MTPANALPAPIQRILQPNESMLDAWLLAVVWTVKTVLAVPFWRDGNAGWIQTARGQILCGRGRGR
jgi:hypothetical protein